MCEVPVIKSKLVWDKGDLGKELVQLGKRLWNHFPECSILKPSPVKHSGNVSGEFVGAEPHLDRSSLYLTVRVGCSEKLIK